MTPTYYLHNNQLFKIDRMPPDTSDYFGFIGEKEVFDTEAYHIDCKDFRAYLSTLQPIPHELNGEGIQVEGKGFEWRYEYRDFALSVWVKCSPYEWQKLGDSKFRRRVAVPIEAKEQAAPQEESLLDIAKSMYESAKKLLEQLEK